MSERRSYDLPKFKRRTFLKAAGVLGGAAAIAGGAELLTGQGGMAEAAAPVGPIKEVYAACTMECIHCSLIAEVQDGKIINIKGNKDFNTQPCLRGLSRAQWVYSKDRILHPMKRVGERGAGQWQQIGWDEALNTIADKMKEVQATSGPKGFLDIGGQDTLDQSRYIICWGNNPAVTNQGYFKKITAAVNAGAKLVVIDPRYSETAAKAHEWISIKPGTDTALAMGMLRVIITEKRYDEQFLLNKSGAPFLLKNGDQVEVDKKPQVMDSA